MGERIKRQKWYHFTYYAIFGIGSALLLIYYLSNTLLHYTTSQQFPVNSFLRFPLTILIFPAELFSILFAFYFVYNLFTDRFRSDPPAPIKNKRDTAVAFCIPVYNEPEDIVERTLEAVSNVEWPGRVRIYLCDDSDNDDDRKTMQRLARRFRARYVERDDKPRGKKAGNINYAVKHVVTEPYFVILDADQAPRPEFLNQTMDQFSDERVGFVQTPQHFIGETSAIERAAKNYTNIFYQAQCVSKARDGALPFCGTNAVVRTDVFLSMKGFAYYTATEDIDLGIRMNAQGFYGAYVPEVLVEGFAPNNIKAWTSQQYRWANGNLAILRENIIKLFTGDFSLRYQIHTFFTLGWWLIGIVTLLYILVPLLSFWLGLGTHHTWMPSSLIALLYLNVVLGIGMIYMSLKNRLSSEKVTLVDAFLQYSLLTNSLFIYARAAIAALFKRYVGFVRTDKKASGSSWKHVKWNLALGAVTFVTSIIALYQGMLATEWMQVRTFVPVSAWLLFYSLILFSSVLFVGEPAGARAEHTATAAAGTKRGVTA